MTGPPVVGDYRCIVSSACYHPSKTLLYGLSHQDMGMAENVTDKIDAPGGHREDLVILFHLQAQLGL